MEERMIRLESKLDKIVETQAEIKADLQEHMRRTEIAELGIDKLSEAIRPLQKHKVLVDGLGSILAWLLGIGAALATIYAAVK